MPLKESINRALGRALGYHLTKGRPGEVGDELARLRREVRELRSAPKGKPAPRPPRREFPLDFDEQFQDIIRQVRPYTMTDINKLHVLLSATQYVVRHGLAGDFVECGVWRGGSMHAAARMLDSLGDRERDLYLFDTYEGMPPPSEADARGGRSAADLLASSAKDTRMWAIASLEDVKAGFETVPYPAERVHFVPGKVEDTIPAHLPERIALLRLDTDWYESTAHELVHAYERLVPGGVLLLDDYGDWEGAKLATDEFLERTGEPLLLVRMSTGRAAVKPFR